MCWGVYYPTIEREIAVEIKTQAVKIINTGVRGLRSLSMEEIVEKSVCKVACLK
jgi:hypothetical protein